jgi:hypothetical protein
MDNGELITNQDKNLKAYLRSTVDLMDILSRIKTDQIKFKYKRNFVFGKKAKDVKTKTTNEEATAIENLMARYCYALAFFAEKKN